MVGLGALGLWIFPSALFTMTPWAIQFGEHAINAEAARDYLGLIIQRNTRYGELYIADNVAPQAITLQNTFYVWTTAWVQSELLNMTADAAAGTLTAQVPGIYRMTCALAASSSGASQVYEFALFRNGIYAADHSAHFTLPNNVGNSCTLTGIINLAEGDVIDLRAQNVSSAGKSLLIEDANLSIM